MSAFGPHSREELRQSYLDAWRKRREGGLLSPLESLIAEVIGLHPEYQPVVEDADRALAAGGDGAADNPFLHMGLHMAVREQIAIDRPPGIQALHGQLCAAVGNVHDAEHTLMEALAEILWQAQRDGREPDVRRYLELAHHRLPGRSRT